MVDQNVVLLRTHPLEAWSDAFAELPDAVGISVEPFIAMVDVRLGSVGTVGAGLDLPTEPNTWVSTDTGRAGGSAPTSGC